LHCRTTAKAVVEIQTAMKKGGGGMEKKYRVAILVLLTAIVVLGYFLFSTRNNQVSTDCLRGNQAACAYFDAQEEVSRLREELNAAKTSLAEARVAYKSSQ
jgi:preprotein translocase subunit SecF